VHYTYSALYITTSVSGTDDGIVWHALIATSKRMVIFLWMSTVFLTLVQMPYISVQYGPNLPWELLL